MPGAGHLYLGRPVRAAIIFLTIGATFWAGVAMGGVMTVDSRNERWWFIAEMFTGFHGLAAWRLEEKVTARLAAEANIPSATRRAGLRPASHHGPEVRPGRRGAGQPDRHDRPGLRRRGGPDEPDVHLRRPDAGHDGPDRRDRRPHHAKEAKP